MIWSEKCMVLRSLSPSNAHVLQNPTHHHHDTMRHKNLLLGISFAQTFGNRQFIDPICALQPHFMPCRLSLADDDYKELSTID